MTPRAYIALFGVLLSGLVGCTPSSHQDTVVGTAGSTCAECHTGAYTRAPFDHASVNYGRDCETCHLETTWTPIDAVEHDRFFPLIGAHDDQGCAACHTEGRADPQPTLCVGCHAADRVGITPDHARLGDGCDRCHTSDRWRPAAFDHDVVFPLRGAHERTECASCHIDEVYEGTPRACVGCHAEERDRAEPDHRGFPDDCARCHTVEAWRPAGLDHDTFYPLLGAHAQAECGSCHVDDVYAGTPRTCVGCHASDRDRAETDHGGFSDACDRCHTVDAWRPAEFDHDVVYPLTGAHRQAECGSCHVDDVYAGTPRDCVACHATDRDRAEPDHARFPNDCAECHTTTAWEGARFEHDVFFRLEGAHADPARVECGDCHVNDVFAGTPRTCVGCHASDRDVARPTHVRFDDGCTGCHTQNDWAVDAHRHQQFVVPHEGVSRCGDCHTNRDDYRLVGCTTCHEHSRNNTDGEHRGIRDYRYADAACLECHPRGRE